MAYSVSKIRKRIKKDIKKDPKRIFREVLEECINCWLEDRKENSKNSKSLKLIDKEGIESLWEFSQEMMRINLDEALAETLDSIKEEPEEKK